MRFKKGESGNPGGRKPGAPNKVTRSFKEAILAVFDDMGGATALLKWAKENPGEFYRIAARLVPPGSPVHVEGLEGSLTAQGEAVIKAMSAGTITPEQANTVMQVLSTHASVTKVDELQQRLATLERKLNV